MWPSFRCLNARCSHMLVSAVFVTQNLAKISSNTSSTSFINQAYHPKGPYLSSSILCRTFRRRQLAFSSSPIITDVIIASTIAGARAHHAGSRDRRINVTIMWTRRIHRPEVFDTRGYLYLSKQVFSQSWPLVPRQQPRRATTSDDFIDNKRKHWSHNANEALTLLLGAVLARKSALALYTVFWRQVLTCADDCIGCGAGANAGCISRY